MEATLGTLLDRLQGFFSKSFFLTGFLPAVAFLALNVLLTVAVFPSTRDPVTAFFDLSNAAHVTNWVVVFLLAFVFGMVTWSLNPWLRQFMEGRYLPSWLRERLEGVQYHEFVRLKKKRDDLRGELFDYRRARQKSPIWEEKLKAARTEGDSKTLSKSPLPDTLVQASENLDKLRQQWRLISYQEMEQQFNELEGELKARPVNSQLDQLHDSFIELLEYASQRIEIPVMKLSTELRLRFPRNTIRLAPTQLANLAEVHREYALQRYGLDVELFWLRMLKIVKADSDFYPILEDAKTQLDFSVAVTALSGILTLVWFLPSMLLAPTPTPYLLVAGIGPPATFILYRIVLQNYRTFTEAVRSAIDLYRFELLKALHISLPEDAKREKERWEQLSVWTNEEGKSPIQYQHEPQGEAGGSGQEAGEAK